MLKTSKTARPIPWRSHSTTTGQGWRTSRLMGTDTPTITGVLAHGHHVSTVHSANSIIS